MKSAGSFEDEQKIASASTWAIYVITVGVAVFWGIAM
jgi:hypothetical protein